VQLRGVPKGGALAGPNPTDRGKPASKYHLLVDHHGLPLRVLLSAADTHDSTLFEPLLETNPAVRGHRPHPAGPDADRRSCTPTRTTRVAADICTGERSRSASPSCSIEDRTKLGRHRWVVERTVSWRLCFKRIGLRDDRTQLTLRPLLTLGCVLITLRRLVQQES
jgi:transposase